MPKADPATSRPADPTPTPASAAWFADLAIQRLGDTAHRYLGWLRETYPQADAHGLARLAIARLERRAPYTAVLGGPAGALAVLALQAEVVLHVAAAYGHDPRDPGRVPELVELVEPRIAVVPLVGRVVRRLFPGTGPLVNVFAGRAAVDGAARRATAYYGAARRGTAY